MDLDATGYSRFEAMNVGGGLLIGYREPGSPLG